MCNFSRFVSKFRQICPIAQTKHFFFFQVRSSLAERIYRLGLAHGHGPSAPPPPADEEDGGAGASNDLKQLVTTADDDADHESGVDSLEEFNFGGGGEPDGGVPKVEWRRALSLRTPIRFHLSYRTKSVQQLLERMFDEDLRPT